MDCRETCIKWNRLLVAKLGVRRFPLSFIDSWDYIDTWRCLVKLPSLPEGRIETVKIDFSKLSKRVNTNHLYQIVLILGVWPGKCLLIQMAQKSLSKIYDSFQIKCIVKIKKRFDNRIQSIIGKLYR